MARMHLNPKQIINIVALLALGGALLSACSVREIRRQNSIAAADAATPAATMDYLVYLPKDYDAVQQDSTEWPVLFFLHGIVQSGNDLRMLPKYGPAQQIEAGRDFPFIVITPQMSAWSWDVDATVAFIEHCIETYAIDPNRVYLSGVSLGGRGVWSVGAARPDLFAAIAPVAGWGKQEEAEATAQIPAWIFHGEKDPLIWPSAAEKMHAAREAAGGNAELTLVPGAGHTIWDEVFAGDLLYEWMLAQSRDAAPGDTDGYHGRRDQPEASTAARP
ncbi:MAG: prolyl oligopeptidase family serine peptidase [Gammaproteobacteria bacterium]|nr:prolyl oligopeptidase family serine peptidase [Gammaproteobacteria bacterium]MBT8443480.1 prolyl oligopeptidase family serine peptidase [Gammaproteobacteria bacterium]